MTWTARLIPAAIAFGFFGPLVYWVVDRTLPVEVYSANVVSPIVPRGGSLVIEYELKYPRLCSGVAQRFFIDSTDTLIPIEPYKFEASTGRNERVIVKDHTEKLKVSATVPYGAAPGVARYQTITEYFCNPLQRLTGWGITYKFPVLVFEVSGEKVPPDAPSTFFRPLSPKFSTPQNISPLEGIAPPLPLRPMEPN